MMKCSIEKLVIQHQGKTLVDISFEIREAFALVGQSGSGKSLTLKALLGMLPQNLTHTLEIDADFTLRRGIDVAIVPQNPFTALSPLTKISKQFMLEIDEATAYMQMVDLDPGFLDRYPSELSGGQLQRVIIAMALSSKPKLLLLDEPTTALDSKTKNQILQLVKKLQLEVGYKLLFVTHDIESTRFLCDDIGILKDGIIVERGSVEAVFDTPREAYTKTLISSNFKERSKRT